MRTTDATVDRRVLQRIVTCATQHGASRTRLEAVAGLDRDPRPRTDARRLLRLWEVAVEATQPELTWHLARTVRLADLGLYGFVIQTAPTAKAALNASTMLFGLVSELLGWAWRGDAVQIIGPRPRDAGDLIVREAMVTQFALLSRQAAPELRLRKVQLRRSAAGPCPLDQLDCPITRGAPEDRIELAPSTFDTPTTHAHPELHAHLWQQGLRTLRSPMQGEDFFGTLHRRITARMHEVPNLEAVARDLRMTPRTLRRRLSERGTSFRECVDDLRRQRAATEVVATHRPLTEIALDLGFSELSAFTRAYRRWFGHAPSEARRVAVNRRH